MNTKTFHRPSNRWPNVLLGPLTLAFGFTAWIWIQVCLLAWQQATGTAAMGFGGYLPDLSANLQAPFSVMILVASITTIGIFGLAMLTLQRERQLLSKEREARLAKQRLIDAIEAIPDGFAMYDCDDRLVVFNEAYRSIYAHSADAIAPGAKFTDILRYGAVRGQYPAALGRVDAWIDERLQAHRNPSGPFEQELPNGRWLHIEERRTEAGDIVGIRADITELKRRELKLQQQTALLMTTFEHMSEGISVIDTDGCLVRMNRELQRQLALPSGFPGGSITFADGLDFVCAKDRTFDGQEVEDIGDLVRKVIGGSRDRYTWHSDSGLILEISGSPLPGGGHVITYADVTNLHATLERLQASEAQKSAIIGASTDAVITADERGRVIEFNRAAETIFGYTAEEAVGQLLQHLIIPPDLRASHSMALERFLRTGEKSIIGKRVEVPAIDKGGRTFPVEITISATRLGRRYVFSAFMRDITDRKRAEAEREAAREAAEAANRAKSDFLAMISHELRTPMNGIIGLSTLLLDSQLDHEQKRFACGIDQSANHLLNLINEILDFSRMEAGRIEITQQNFDLARLVETVTETTRILVRAKPIEVVAIVDPALPKALISDPGRIQQILQNLLGNCAKFTRRGRIELKIEHIGEDSDAHRLRLTVADTGIGIPQDMMGRLFQPFERAEATMAQAEPGTGLGLAITKKLVELLGGAITVETEVGKGTRFTIDISLHVPSIATATALTQAPTSEREASKASPPRRILVAEDTPASQLVVRTMLERSGHTVHLVDNGQDAVAAIASESFDIAILDLQMPIMSGWDVLAAVRAMPQAKARIPVIALTAQATAADIERTRACGFDRHISKPVRRVDLTTAIDELMEFGQQLER